MTVIFCVTNNTHCTLLKYNGTTCIQVQYVALRKQQKRPGSNIFNELELNGMCQNIYDITSMSLRQ